MFRQWLQYSRRLRTHAFFTIFVVLPLHSQQPKPNFVLPDGSVPIVTGLGMEGVTRQLDAVFVSLHAGTRFNVRSGDNYSAMAALTFDRSAVAPMGCQYTRIGLGNNLKIAAEPLGLRIAHASLSAGSKVPQLGVIVNASNPVQSLSVAQLTRIFAVGAAGGDIAVWGQAGVKGELADRQVNPSGPMPSDYLASDDPQAGEFLSTEKFSALNMNHRYIGLAHYADVVKHVAEDEAAIGIVALNEPLPGVKVLPLRNLESSPAVAPTADNIAAGRYPLDRFIYLYLRVGKGAPLEGFASEYARIALSAEGQQAIAGGSGEFIPLNQVERMSELAKLDQ